MDVNEESKEISKLVTIKLSSNKYLSFYCNSSES